MDQLYTIKCSSISVAKVVFHLILCHGDSIACVHSAFKVQGVSLPLCESITNSKRALFRNNANSSLLKTFDVDILGTRFNFLHHYH